jgi:hypothetical protein
MEDSGLYVLLAFLGSFFFFTVLFHIIDKVLQRKKERSDNDGKA